MPTSTRRPGAGAWRQQQPAAHLMAVASWYPWTSWTSMKGSTGLVHKQRQGTGLARRPGAQRLPVLCFTRCFARVNISVQREEAAVALQLLPTCYSIIRPAEAGVLMLACQVPGATHRTWAYPAPAAAHHLPRRCMPFPPPDLVFQPILYSCRTMAGPAPLPGPPAAFRPHPQPTARTPLS